VLKNVLLRLNLNCRGQYYDKAVNMAGLYKSGVRTYIATQISEYEQKPFYPLLWACLNLATPDTM